MLSTKYIFTLCLMVTCTKLATLVDFGEKIIPARSFLGHNVHYWLNCLIITELGTVVVAREWMITDSCDKSQFC